MNFGDVSESCPPVIHLDIPEFVWLKAQYCSLAGLFVDPQAVSDCVRLDTTKRPSKRAST